MKAKIISMMMLITMAAVSQQSMQIVLQPDGACGKDAVIASCLPCGFNTTNYGSSTEFNAIANMNGGNVIVQRSLIQFDLTKIPPGSVIQTASLSLYFDPSNSNGTHSTAGGSNKALLQEITAPWDENTVTWNNQPAVSSVNQVTLPASTSPTQDYLDYNVQAMVQDFVNNPNQNYGMMLELLTETAVRQMVFASSDHTNSALHPKLVVTYIPATTSCLTLKYAACNGIDALIADCGQCGYLNSNFGSHTDFLACAWTNGGNVSDGRTLVYWDLTQIPSSATILSADLMLYAYPSPYNGQHSTLSGSNAAYIQKITGPWSESTVSWATQPATTPVNQVMLPASTSPTQDYTVSVTALVQDMVSNPSNNYGLMLRLVTESFYRRLVFASSDNPNPALHPRLDICYTIPLGVSETPKKADELLAFTDLEGHVTIIYPENSEGGNMTIYNSAGQLVKSIEGIPGTQQTFDLSALSGGFYFYHYDSKTHSKTGKLVIR